MRENAGVLLSSHLLDDEDKLDDLKDDDPDAQHDPNSVKLAAISNGISLFLFLHLR
jgi:hypothetical protein